MRCTAQDSFVLLLLYRARLMPNSLCVITDTYRRIFETLVQCCSPTMQFRGAPGDSDPLWDVGMVLL